MNEARRGFHTAPKLRGHLAQLHRVQMMQDHRLLLVLSQFQQGFRQSLDTTPMEYLRRLRLEKVHHDLSTAEPGAVTIHVYSPPIRAIGHYDVVDGMLQRTPCAPDEPSAPSHALNGLLGV